MAEKHFKTLSENDESVRFLKFDKDSIMEKFINHQQLILEDIGIFYLWMNQD